MTYPGLSPATLDFLAGLEIQNTRDWFTAHRAEYERDFLCAGLDLVAALSAPAAKLGLMAVPKTNGSLRRIFRDTRFSRDKTPYDPRMHLILSTGPQMTRGPGVHLIIGPHGIGYGAGWYGLDPTALDAFRQRISQPQQRGELTELLSQAAQIGATLGEPDLVKVPRGYQPQPWDHLLRRRSIIARTRAEIPHPAWVFTPEAGQHWLGILETLAPLTLWLARP